MGTTQAFVARLASGRVLPSTRTLERFAKATHTRLHPLRAADAWSGCAVLMEGRCLMHII